MTGYLNRHHGKTKSNQIVTFSTCNQICNIFSFKMNSSQSPSSDRASFMNNLKSSYNSAPFYLKVIIASMTAIVAGSIVFIAIQGIGYALHHDEKKDGKLTSAATSGGFEFTWSHPSSIPSIAPTMNSAEVDKEQTNEETLSNTYKSFIPSQAPTIYTPLNLNTSDPSITSSSLPSSTPTSSPSITVSIAPSKSIYYSPTTTPSVTPSAIPTQTRTFVPSDEPSYSPIPTINQSLSTATPTDFPTISPTFTAMQSSKPTYQDISFYVGSGSILPLNSDLMENKAQFLVHLGNIQGKKDCSDKKANKTMEELLKNIQIPIFLTPGENDWSRCADINESLDIWKQSYVGFETNWIGDNEITVERQTNRTENFAFLQNGVLFIGVHIVEGKGKNRDLPLFDLLLEDAFSFVEQNLHVYGNDALATVIFSHEGNGKKTKPFFDAIDNYVLSRSETANMPILYIESSKRKWKIKSKGISTTLDVAETANGSSFVPTFITISTGNRESPFNIEEPTVPGVQQ